MKDETGSVYGKWEVLSEGPRAKSGRRRLLCRCRCGAEHLVQLNVLKSGESLGCKKESRDRSGNPTQRNIRLDLSNTWNSMMRRCYNKNDPYYKRWGGRGIKVCSRWRLDKEAFINDILTNLGPRPLKAYVLDRIDNDGDYELSNVRWATYSEQMSNRRDNRHLTFDGKTLTYAQWARILGCSWPTISAAVARGESATEIITRISHPNWKQKTASRR